MAGATPGVHFPLSKHYIRRVRLGKYSNLVEPMRAAGYHIEEDAMDKQNSLVVEIPVSLGSDIKTLNDVTMRDQLDMASFM